MPDERPAAKYGMPAALSQPYEAARLMVMQEQALFKELRFQHALRVGPALRAALDGLAGKGAAPVAEVPPSVVTAAPAAPEPVDLRAALGLR